MAFKIRLAVAVTLLSFMWGGTAEAKTETRSCPQFEEAFRKHGLVPVKVFSQIAYRESRCRIKAINATWDANGNITWSLNKNKTWDSGLLQINSGHRERVKKVCKADLPALLTLDCNLKVAKSLLDNGGLAHWAMSTPTTTVP